MASSSMSESDSLPVSSAVQSTKVLREPILTTLRSRMASTRLYALPLAVPVPLQNCFLRAYTL